MAAPDPTQLLIDARAGDDPASRQLFRHVHEALRVLAQERFGPGAPRDAGRSPALAHEAYIRLIDQERAGRDGRAHFLAIASRAFRFMLVDRARARAIRRLRDASRTSSRAPVEQPATQIAADERASDLMDLSECLDELTLTDPRLANIASFRFFGGLNFEDIADVTGRSAATVRNDWVRARAWLYRSMRQLADRRASTSDSA